MSLGRTTLLWAGGAAEPRPAPATIPYEPPPWLAPPPEWFKLDGGGAGGRADRRGIGGSDGWCGSVLTGAGGGAATAGAGVGAGASSGW